MIVRNPSRRYHSPRRAERARRTRERVVTAAEQRFSEHGYAGTLLADIAADAAVSLPTVELLFGTKAVLLKAAIDSATAGDHEPVAMLDRPWTEQARQTTDPNAFLDICSTVLADSAARAAGLVVVAFEAAPLSEELAAVAASLGAQREIMATWLVDGLQQRSVLRAGVTRHWATDTAWALMDPVLFVRLTRHRGWSIRDYAAWFRDTVARLLLP